jgi:hypothetical protein
LRIPRKTSPRCRTTQPRTGPMADMRVSCADHASLPTPKVR